VTKTLEKEEAGNSLYIVAADKDIRLGLSARIGTECKNSRSAKCSVFFLCGPRRTTTDFQGASNHMASFGQNGKM
jgi:hypothetical protein